MKTPDLTILKGDCRERLRDLPAGSVNCCVTSPPYFGLRDYGTGQWEGGGAECDHMIPQQVMGGNGRASAKQVTSAGTQGYQYRESCGKCGARRVDQQIGIEPTPDEFVAQLVEVFREVRRVLRDDGTLWLNLGDSYYGAGQRGSQFGSKAEQPLWRDKPNAERGHARGTPHPTTGLKFKDLIGIPWMVAFALRADGWYLRQDIIWAKPNPMPESVTDRCTKAHEYLFLLSKSERYFYDQDAIREPLTESSIERGKYGWNGKTGDALEMGACLGGSSYKKLKMSGAKMGDLYNPAGRNRRSVWTVPTSPFPDAHFATYPPDLIKPCILAGCPAGGVVLDPFAGSGTTGKVALENGRSAILIELNPDYVKLIEKRCRVNLPLMFEEVA